MTLKAKLFSALTLLSLVVLSVAPTHAQTAAPLLSLKRVLITAGADGILYGNGAVADQQEWNVSRQSDFRVSANLAYSLGRYSSLVAGEQYFASTGRKMPFAGVRIVLFRGN